MSPINPNFKPGVGHLVTDRYDFQSHIDGTDFRQAAGTVDLNPSVLIGSTTITDVQTAIEALAGTIIVPSVPDATTVSKGIIQLNGDLFGNGTTALNPRVSGLQATPISVFSGLAPNQVLTWNGSSWVNQAVPGAISIAGDLAGVGSTLAVPRVGGLQGFAVSSATPTTGQGLVWNGSVWLPTGIPTSPTGTGLASVTSGAFDAAATANARYTGGKIQLSSNLQYINAGITGDLSWLPTTSNKTLTLPNATDTLVGLATTDTLTNKTINATNNTITDTSVATGDILAVIGGGKFTRLAKGANGSFLGVSAGTLGYFTPSSSTPAGTGFAHITGGVYDSNATANIRYAGAKFQTDVNIQFKTTGQLGDLAWGSLTTTRTLSLPDATDTLVGKATVDIFTNKTFDVAGTGNALISTSQATGDLLKNNGAGFLRFAKGSALQVLRVNAAGTDLEYATVTSGGTSSGAVNTVQTSDGASGFLGATNVLAGSGFISIGTTPATTGALRFPNSASDVIIAIKDNGGTNRELISRIGINSVQIGPATTNAYGMTVTGNTIDLSPANQTRLNGTGGLPALTISGAGQTNIHPSNFPGMIIDTNVNTTGAIIQLWGGITGPGAGESRYIGFGNSNTPPTGTPTGGGYLYVETGALKYRGTSGTLTTIATADPHCKKCGRDFMHEWQNDNYGKLSTCVPCMLDALSSLGIDVDAFSDRNLQ